MDQNTPLKISHDVGQSLQRKMEGLADVERAFVHIDYEHEHDTTEGEFTESQHKWHLFGAHQAFDDDEQLTDRDIATEHKALYEARKPRRTLKQVFQDFRRGTKDAAGDSEVGSGGILSNRSSS